jgi:hypothetical protein
MPSVPDGARRRFVGPPDALGFGGVYDWLLFLHVLSAFALFATVVMFSAIALGMTSSRQVFTVADILWNVGGLGTLVLGIWLAIYLDAYQVWDGWILGAIALWAIATELGRRARSDFEPAVSAEDGVATAGLSQGAALMHWLRALTVLALLVLMIWKPGA